MFSWLRGTAATTALFVVLVSLLATPMNSAVGADKFRAWLEELWPDAQALGVSRTTFVNAFKGLTPNYKLPDLIIPPEHREAHLAAVKRYAETGNGQMIGGRMELEGLRADGEHQGQPDRAGHRVATADPVPEAEHVGLVDAEGAHPLGVCRQGDEVFGDVILVLRVFQKPGPRGLRVGHGFVGREGL